MDRRIAPRRITPARVAVSLGTLVLLAVALIAWERYVSVRTVTVPADRVTISRVTPGRFREYVPIIGNIVPRTTVYVDAVDGGRIAAVHAEEGVEIAAGDPLVTLENTQLQLQVIAAEAQLTEQMNQLNQTRLNMEQTRLSNEIERVSLDYRIGTLRREIDRLAPLVGTGGATRGRVEDLEAELGYRLRMRDVLIDAQRVDDEFRATQVTRMRDALDTMSRNLELARENLENLAVTAPITGQLTLLDAHVGETKLPGERLGQVDERGAFKVTAYVDEFYLPRVAVGQVARFTAGGRDYDITVGKIYPDVHDRRFQVDFEFEPGAIMPFRRGQTVRMQLEIGQPADTLIVANGAFYDDTGGQWVFVVDASGAFADRRSIRLGRRNPDSVEVLDGLSAGEQVITSSYSSYDDYDRLRLQRDG